MSQIDTVLAHLRGGPITSAEAISRYKIYRLASRINDLKNRGHQIHTVMIHDFNCKYARYFLVCENTQ